MVVCLLGVGVIKAEYSHAQFYCRVVVEKHHESGHYAYAYAISFLKRASEEFEQTIVMITHNNDIARLADRIVRIEDGKIVG